MDILILAFIIGVGRRLREIDHNIDIHFKLHMCKIQY